MLAQKWQAVLASFAGLTERDPAYADRLFWNDRPEWRPLAARDLYTCGLLARAALHEGGADIGERMALPYQGRNTVISDLVVQARAVGAYRPVSFEECAQPGRILIVGRNGDREWGLPASEHVVCVHLSAASGPQLCRLGTVEGGQRDRLGTDSIQPFERVLRAGQNGVWLGAGEHGLVRARRVGHVFDVTAWPDRA